jgi:hypothetical protein
MPETILHSFTSSPTSTLPSPTINHTFSPERKHIGISTQLSPTQMSPSHIKKFRDTLSFPKCAIQSSSTSTDTEASSDYGVDFHSKHSRSFQVTSPSPSLLTSMMQGNPCGEASAPNSRSSSTSQGPLTPTSSTCGKPILRRENTSAPTSASEDNGCVKGLGLAFTTCDKIKEEPPKRACSLKFAVRSPPSSSSRALSDSGHAQVNLSAARKPKPRSSRSVSVPEEDEDEVSSSHYGHHTLAAPLEQDEEDDEDEGYQEDSEGGFTSEEEEDYFTHATRGRGSRSFQKWAESTAFARSPPGPRRRVSHSADQAVIYTSTNEDCPPPPVTRGPGRQVSIADMRMKFDHCSRHLSPPPKCFDLPENDPSADLEPAPPAASSPSARGLCRRRESANVPPTNTARKQSGLFGPSTSTLPTNRPVNRSTQSDDSAFFTGQCQSILKRDPSSDRMPTSPLLACPARRSSEPKPSQCEVDEQCVNGSVSPVGSEVEGSARKGLERCLGRC